MIDSNDDLFAVLEDIASTLNKAGESSLSTELQDSLYGSTSGEIMGDARAVLRKIRKSEYCNDVALANLVNMCIKTINSALGGWWRA